MTTGDGGLIAQSADGSSNVTFDATGQLSNLPQYSSWIENGYLLGSFEQVAFTLPDLAESFAAISGGNASSNGTAIQQIQIRRFNV
jgi:hypothetical protein